MNSGSIKRETEEENKLTKESLYQNNTNNAKEKTGSEWKISIPAISLEETIAEGTEKENMDLYIGHF